MRAFRFKPDLTPNGDLRLPNDVRAALSKEDGEPESILLFIEERQEDRDWAALTAAEFLAGYDEADAIYDAIV